MKLSSDTIFYLVRHGEAESNSHGILCSWPEKNVFHLTEKGKEQVAEAGRVLAGKGIDVLYASPLTRTMETAQAIANATGLGILVDERIRESDFGIYDARPVEIMKAKYPTDLQRIDSDDQEIESFHSVRKRVGAFLSEVSEKWKGKRITVVSHGDPLEVMFGILHHQTLEESLVDWYPEKGSVTEIVLGKEK